MATQSEPHILVFELHNSILRMMSGTTHFNGLQMAAKHHWKERRISSQVYRRLSSLDTTCHVIRHVAATYAAAMVNDIGEAIGTPAEQTKERRNTKPQVHEKQKGAKQRKLAEGAGGHEAEREGQAREGQAARARGHETAGAGDEAAGAGHEAGGAGDCQTAETGGGAGDREAEGAGGAAEGEGAEGAGAEGEEAGGAEGGGAEGEGTAGEGAGKEGAGQEGAGGHQLGRPAWRASCAVLRPYRRHSLFGARFDFVRLVSALSRQGMAASGHGLPTSPSLATDTEASRTTSRLGRAPRTTSAPSRSMAPSSSPK